MLKNIRTLALRTAELRPECFSALIAQAVNECLISRHNSSFELNPKRIQLCICPKGLAYSKMSQQQRSKHFKVIDFKRKLHQFEV